MNIILLVSLANFLASENLPCSKEILFCARGAKDAVLTSIRLSMSIK
jgi:hypothetical protein